MLDFYELFIVKYKKRIFRGQELFRREKNEY